MSVAAHACARCTPHSRRHARSALIGLLSLCAASLPCRGQDDPAPIADDADSGSLKRFSLTVGIDGVTTYQFRGFVYEESGPIVQPFVDLELLLADFDSAAVRLLFGTWHSFHGQATDSESEDRFRKHWFEADASAGIDVDIGPWTVTAQYNLYTSPSDAWPTMQEVALALSYNDGWLPKGWSMNPHALLAFEVGPAANDGLRNGVFLEFGVCPTYEVSGGPCDRVELSFLISIGLSLSNYYEIDDGRNDPFGFVSLGGGAMVPLGTAGPANWSVSFGIQALLLGGAAAEFNDGERSVLVGSVGLALEF